MTNNNPYENENTVDIPDFVEDKTDTTTTSVDMSIFKMSDDELYDDDDENQNETEELKEQKPKKKKGAGSIVLVILLLLVAIGLVVSILFLFKYKNGLDAANLQVSQLTQKNTDLQAQITTKDAQISELQLQLEEAKKAKETKKTVKVTDGPIYFREGPSTNDAETEYDGQACAYTGDEFDLIEVVDGGSYKWAKIGDKVYFAISKGDDVFAEVSE